MAADRDDVLDGLRSDLAGRLRGRWNVRKVMCIGCGLCRRQDRSDLRPMIAQLRALDAIREQARDRAFMADVWMYMHCGLSREDAAKRARAEHGYDAAAPTPPGEEGTGL